MATTAEDWLETFADFASAPDAQDLYVAVAEELTADLPSWNNSESVRNLAVAFRAAHAMVLSGLGSTTAQGGTVQSESIGAASVTYATPTAAFQTELSLTPYGRQLQELQRTYIFSALTTYPEP